MRKTPPIRSRGSRDRFTPEDARRHLLEAAGEEFAEKGCDQATVRDILKRAGMKNIAAINYYFENKDKLYEAVLRHAFQCRLEHMPMPNWEPGLKPEAKLRLFVRGVVMHMLQDQYPWQLKLLLRELGAPTAAGQALVRDFIRPIYEELWRILRELLGPEVPEEKLHLLGFSIVGQIFYQRVARPVLALVVGAEEHRTYTPERLAEHIADFSLAALGLAPPRGVKEVPSWAG
jgi:AcrR family transcriptional regulator